ncbi:MAG: ISAs1 family transposase [Pontiellaceae bacterium]|nr:ISAs1 family transposase [Pontiellaceae bacterium]MBN2785537.1 ISAs1 family transposase [Pontiellaceae bacterium]
MALLCGCRDVASIYRFASRLTQIQRAKIGLPLKTRRKKFRGIPDYQVFYTLLRDIDPKDMARVLTEHADALTMDGKFIGDTVTADALHTQHETARIIIEKGGNYLLQVKGNQGTLLKTQEKAFAPTRQRYGRAEKKHGRIEQRAIAVIATNAKKCSFPHAHSAIAIRLKNERNGKETATVRYYISTHDPTRAHPVDQWQNIIREHWGGGKNRNHWIRDAIWREDATRSRNPNLVGNLALLRNTLLAVAADELESYGNLPAFTEAMQTDRKLPFDLTTRTLRG